MREHEADSLAAANEKVCGFRPAPADMLGLSTYLRKQNRAWPVKMPGRHLSIALSKHPAPGYVSPVGRNGAGYR